MGIRQNERESLYIGGGIRKSERAGKSGERGEKNGAGCTGIYKKMGAVLLAAAAITALTFWADNTRMLPYNEKKTGIPLERNKPGGGERREELEVTLDGETMPLTVEVGEQEYTETQLEEMFERAEKELEGLILGENPGLDEVRDNLELVTEIPNTGIRVSWELDNYEVMSLQGKLQTDRIPDDGILLKLTAMLLYKEEKAQVMFYAHVYPPILSNTEKKVKKLQEEMKRRNEETKEEEYFLLPTAIDGIPVSWGYVRDFRAVGILLLGVAFALLLYALEAEKEKKKKKRRDMQLELDYPRLISKFTLYLGAGMAVRKVWYRIADEYERQKKEKGSREVYEEMLYTMHEIQGGGSEGECYERFGERCALPVYKKFGTILSQNLRKGTRGLTVLLKQEAEQAFEERKSLARRLGEEAGTKMLVPMFLMLLVVLVMIVVPAFFSIHI